MKIKSLAAALLTTLTIASASATIATPAAVFSAPIIGSSFSNQLVGNITIGSLSDLTGSLFAADTLSGIAVTPWGSFNYTLSLDGVTFTSGTVGSLSGDTDLSAAGFAFHNVAAGTYAIKASGTLDGLGQSKSLALIGASYTVTPVPEPETYAMLLAGLGLMGAVARRRNKSKAA